MAQFPGALVGHYLSSHIAILASCLLFCDSGIMIQQPEVICDDYSEVFGLVYLFYYLTFDDAEFLHDEVSP